MFTPIIPHIVVELDPDDLFVLLSFLYASSLSHYTIIPQFLFKECTIVHVFTIHVTNVTLVSAYKRPSPRCMLLGGAVLGGLRGRK